VATLSDAEVERLKHRLSSRSDADTRAALEEAERIADERLLPDLLEIVREHRPSPEEHERGFTFTTIGLKAGDAVEAVVARCGGTALAALEPVLLDPMPHVRAWAARLLPSLGSSPFTLLAAAARHSDPAKRRIAVEELGRTPPGRFGEEPRETVVAILRAKLDDPDSDVVVTALASLWERCAFPEPRAVALLEHPQPAIVAAAFLPLRATRALPAGCEQELFGGPGVIAALERLASPAHRDFVRKEALMALAATRRPRALDLLIDALSDVGMGSNACRLIDAWRSPETARALCHGVSHSVDPRARARAAILLGGYLGGDSATVGEDVRAILRSALRDTDSSVVEAAASGLSLEEILASAFDETAGHPCSSLCALISGRLLRIAESEPPAQLRAVLASLFRELDQAPPARRTALGPAVFGFLCGPHRDWHVHEEQRGPVWRWTDSQLAVLADGLRQDGSQASREALAQLAALQREPHRRERVRAALATALATGPSGPASSLIDVRRWRETLGSLLAIEREAAALVLGAFEISEARDDLRALLADPDARVASAAAVALADLCDTEAAPSVCHAYRRWAKPPGQLPAPDLVLGRFVEALGRVGDASSVRDLLALSFDGCRFTNGDIVASQKEESTERAVQMLVKRFGAELVPLILRTFTPPYELTRSGFCTGIRALGACQDARAKPFLRRLVRGCDADRDVLPAVLDALRAMDATEAAEDLASLACRLTDPQSPANRDEGWSDGLGQLDDLLAGWLPRASVPRDTLQVLALLPAITVNVAGGDIIERRGFDFPSTRAVARHLLDLKPDL
jgi:HEAT repeat protein